MTTTDDARLPEPGTDSRVEDRFGQSVDRDAELAVAGANISTPLTPSRVRRARQR